MLSLPLCPKEIHSILKEETPQRDPPERYFALMKVFQKVHEGLYKGSANLKQSWNQYRSLNPGGYGYSQFVANFRAWQRVQGVEVARCTTWRITHP